MKKGFTMIELIFVIVILGILAAIAVPKLTSVKDDAEATKMLSNLKTFVDKELITYHAANDKFPEIKADADIKKFSDVKEVKMKTATNTSTGITEYKFKAGADEACIEITTNNSAGTVTLKPNKTTTNKGCQVALVAAVKNGYLAGTVASDKVTDITETTVVSAVGGNSGRYDTSEAFKPADDGGKKVSKGETEEASKTSPAKK